ncbi:hypothetical protein PF004_g27966 [Phytophthora fragariae]|uniref:Uncharacterized protein n=2 Tax=Phytophthora TaxID=4783 RepID=A0A6A3HJI6_9STRA|nr:hypothetical protein PR001_g27222 [Phytophthora rubi]KAE8970766.1 hypothetical protein PR002_g27015 [Phytophthora rubi]KAE9170160.1 hypothetical protein PF004_g27966 [Phytophthora fragariae]
MQKHFTLLSMPPFFEYVVVVVNSRSLSKL